MKSANELDMLKEEYTTVCGKLAELSDEEMNQVTGGAGNNGVILIAERLAGVEPTGLPIGENIEVALKGTPGSSYGIKPDEEVFSPVSGEC